VELIAAQKNVNIGSGNSEQDLCFVALVGAQESSSVAVKDGNYETVVAAQAPVMETPEVAAARAEHLAAHAAAKAAVVEAPVERRRRSPEEEDESEPEPEPEADAE